jgi:anti-sigma factor ChrR (cupin superfamily)
LETPKLPAFDGDAWPLPRDRALQAGAARLRAAVAELPLRYAPFFGRLAGLWGISEATVQSELARAKDATGWSRTLLPGLRAFEIETGRARERARLLRFEPGSRFPNHRHRGAERLLVLEGAFADGRGAKTHAGDECAMAPGSEHELYILGNRPCVAAVAEHGIEFRGSLLRFANWLFR